LPSFSWAIFFGGVTDLKATRWRRIVISLFAAGTPELLRFSTLGSQVLQWLTSHGSKPFGLPSVMIDGLVMCTVGVSTHLMLDTKVGERLYNRWMKLASEAAAILRRPEKFTQEERGERAFRRDVIRSMKSSHCFYSILVSGHTMHSGHERFILDNITAGELQRKDIRILLLNRGSSYWQERGERFAKELNVSIEDYRRECHDTEILLKNRLSAHVAHYQICPTWRLYMFADRAFVSRYFMPPEEAFADSRKGPIIAFAREHPFYHWLYCEFRRLCPPEWKDEPAREAAMQSGLSNEKIQEYAHRLWEEHGCPVPGSPEWDWKEAKTQLLKELEAAQPAVLPPCGPPLENLPETH
jgi:hypothetical protein